MNIDFELYRVFYTVANNGNITKASEELNISQPAISKSIKNLEEQLGGQLFVRTKRGVVLTEEGKEFYNYIRQAIEYINTCGSGYCSVILTKSDENGELFKKSVNSQNVYVNENPFRYEKFSLPEEYLLK